MVLTDLNGDGAVDLARAHIYLVQVDTQMTKGYGRLYGDARYEVDGWPSGIATGDLDGDGDLDLVTANALTNNVGLLFRQPSGVYHIQYIYIDSAGYSPGDIKVGDLDGDGDLDIAVAVDNGFVKPAVVALCLRQADGSYTQRQITNGGIGPQHLAVADLDGDGDLDLATANFYNSVTLFLREMDGSYRIQTIRDNFLWPSTAVEDQFIYGKHYTGDVTDIEVGDFDGDGDQDLATSNHSGENVTLLLRQADGNYTIDTPVTVGDAQGQMATGDIDGDGYLDLVIANWDSTLTVLLRQADDGYVVHTVSLDAWPDDVAIGDLDGDGDSDIVTTNHRGAPISIILNERPPMLASRSRFVRARAEAVSPLEYFEYLIFQSFGTSYFKVEADSPSSAQIEFFLREDSKVTAELYNMFLERIRVLQPATVLPADIHYIRNINEPGLLRGTYLVRLTTVGVASNERVTSPVQVRLVGSGQSGIP